MQAGPRAGALFRQAGVTAIYLVALVVFRQISVNHWIILTGFHLVALLLVPYRYWPALFAGDVARLAYVSYTCVDQFGLLWALINLIPFVAYAAPVVWFFRERHRLFPEHSAVNVPALVSCSLIVAALATAVTIGQLQITPLPHGYVIHYGEVIARLMLGNFMGVLTVTPIALVGWQSTVGRSWRQWSQGLTESRLVIESVYTLVPVAFLSWLGTRDAQLRPVAQMAMFLPVVVLAMRHGWKGAAVAGTMASLGIVYLMPTTNDLATLQAETLVALAIGTMLLVGACVTVSDGRAERHHTQMRLNLALAQRNVYLGEAQMRATAQGLDHLRGSIQGAFDMILRRLHYLQPVADEAGYRQHILHAQEQLFRLTDAMHPSLLGDRGLPAALAHGALPRLLNEAGVKYWCDLRGPVSGFPQTMHLAAYRIVAEAIAVACAERDVSDVLVKIRCGTQRRPWLVIMVEARKHQARACQVDWEGLLPSLRFCASGLGHKAIHDRAATFEGSVRERSSPLRGRLTVSLLEPSHSHA